MKITPADVNGLLGIVPTPATADADHWSTLDSVNLPETEKMIGLMVEAGLDMILTNGTFGECATLTREEHLSFNACVVDTVAGSVPVFAGVGTLNTRDTIDRGRALIDSGADGLFVARPMWLALTQPQILRFYQDIAEALPGVPLIVYDNPVAFKGKIERDTYVALGAIREVVAAKHVGGPALETDAEAVGETCRILPVGADWYRTARARPDLMTAAWSGHVACAPAPIVALAAAIKAHDWDEAERIAGRCGWAEEPMMAGGDFAAFMNHSIEIGHLRFAAAGLIDPGPPRPPYIVGLPETYRAGATETGKRWATLQDEFTREAVAA